jgi:hypothetical protein
MSNRVPKVVALFTYTGNTVQLRNKLNGAILDAVRPEFLALRDVLELTESIRIVEFGVNDRWEYYPKVVTSRDFEPSEYAMVNAAVQTVVATLQSQLAAEGATNIVVDFDVLS